MSKLFNKSSTSKWSYNSFYCTFIKFILFLLIILISIFNNGYINAQDQKNIKIWENAPHNAFTSLVQFDGSFYCCFREATSHVDRYYGGNGKIRVLKSEDGLNWNSHSLIAMDSVDLRDPQLSVTPDGKLMLLMAKCRYLNGSTLYSFSEVAFLSKDDLEFSEPQAIQMNISNMKFNWLWKVRWFKNVAYGVTVLHPEGCFFVKSNDGINYEIVSKLNLEGYPNEAALDFKKNGTLRLVIRRDSASQHAFFGESNPPYTQWTWSDLDTRVGSPEILTLRGGRTILASRDYSINNIRTTIYRLESNAKLTPILYLPSGGDCSYPGMTVKNRNLYISYYSSHEGKASIYLSINPLKKITKHYRSKTPIE